MDFRFRPRFLLGLALCGWAAANLTGAPARLAVVPLEHTLLEATTITDGFDAPFALAWGPDNFLWCTQLDGTVWRVDPASGERTAVLHVPGVFYRKSHGLQSLAFPADFAHLPYLYLHYVYQVPTTGAEEVVRSRVVRCRWDGHALGALETVVDAIPGRSYHNGSRLRFGPDGKLYLTIGDTGNAAGAQDPAVITGKVLRYNPDGSIPADNPFPGSPVWTVGHRNPQGLVFAPNGRVYEAEHGPNNDDEVNLLKPGHNYGWPVVEGDIDKPAEIEAARTRAITEPLRAWTPTVAPSGLAYYDHPAIPEWRNHLLLVNLKGRALRVLALDQAGDRITQEQIFLQERLGRLRDVCVSPAGDVYLLTSNTDWHPRFQPWMYPNLPKGPDRIVRLRAGDPAALARDAAAPGAAVWPQDLTPLALVPEDWSFPATTEDLKAGQGLYAVNCATCHLPDGGGTPGLIPPLNKSEWVSNKNRLIQVVLRGMSGRIVVEGQPYEQEMPSFRNLSDDDLAAILTYVRATFGPRANAVIPNEILEERKSLP